MLLGVPSQSTDTTAQQREIDEWKAAKKILCQNLHLKECPEGLPREERDQFNNGVRHFNQGLFGPAIRFFNNSCSERVISTPLGPQLNSIRAYNIMICEFYMAFESRENPVNALRLVTLKRCLSSPDYDRCRESMHTLLRYLDGKVKLDDIISSIEQLRPKASKGVIDISIPAEGGRAFVMGRIFFFRCNFAEAEIEFERAVEEMTNNRDIYASENLVESKYNLILSKIRHRMGRDDIWESDRCYTPQFKKEIKEIKKGIKKIKNAEGIDFTWRCALDLIDLYMDKLLELFPV